MAHTSAESSQRALSHGPEADGRLSWTAASELGRTATPAFDTPLRFTTSRIPTLLEHRMSNKGALDYPNTGIGNRLTKSVEYTKRPIVNQRPVY